MWKINFLQVFEKWKREHDELLKERFRKQRETESKLKFKKEEQEEERKKDSKSAFSNWWVEITELFLLLKEVFTFKHNLSVYLPFVL